MRFLANENFPLASVNRLRNAGHDVAAVIEDSPGAKDADILARAARETRIILTFDRDYGELIYRLRLPPPIGVIYFRLRGGICLPGQAARLKSAARGRCAPVVRLRGRKASTQVDARL